MVFTGLTVGHYYELQKKNSSSWQTNLKPTTNYPNNKPDEASEISLVVEDGETYRLKEWKKQFSYGEVAEEIKTKLVTEGAAVEYRLVKLRYTFKNRERLCNWIINKNTFTEIFREGYQKNNLIKLSTRSLNSHSQIMHKY